MPILKIEGDGTIYEGILVLVESKEDLEECKKQGLDKEYPVYTPREMAYLYKEVICEGGNERTEKGVKAFQMFHAIKQNFGGFLKLPKENDEDDKTDG